MRPPAPDRPAQAPGPDRGAERARPRKPGLGTRIRRAWRNLSPEHRWATLAALGLFVTMFLPWYSTTSPAAVKVHGKVAVGAAQGTEIAIQVLSFVEAAVLLLALGVLFMMFARGEGRAFHLPGGDGLAVMAAGGWTAFLIFWRFFDKPDVGRGVAVGLHWGIFIALLAAGALAYAGSRLRAANVPEPKLPQPRPPDVGQPSDEPERVPDERPWRAEPRRLPPRPEPPPQAEPPPPRPESPAPPRPTPPAPPPPSDRDDDPRLFE